MQSKTGSKPLKIRMEEKVPESLLYVLNAAYITSGKLRMTDVDDVNKTIVEFLFFLLSTLFDLGGC